MAEHNTHLERTLDAGGGFAWYGRCSCGWHGYLRVSQQGAKEDAAANRQAMAPEPAIAFFPLG